MHPAVTVITSTYNIIDAGRKEFFLQCVDSVKRQNYPNIEHIIVDGKSDDGSLELFDELNLLYYSEKDTSIYDAFNKGIKLAKGNYIIYLNSDDYFTDENSVSALMQALQQSKADFTCSDYEIINQDLSRYRQVPRFKCFYLYNPFCHQTVLASKEMLLKLGGFNEKYKVYADYDLLLRALLQGYAFCYVDKVTVAFREGGISSGFDEKKQDELVEIYKAVYAVSEKKARRLSQYGCLPYNVMKSVLGKLKHFRYIDEVIHYNNVCLLKYFLKQIITCKFTKGKRLIKILGITLYNENAIK